MAHTRGRPVCAIDQRLKRHALDEREQPSGFVLRVDGGREISKTPIPIPDELSLLLSAAVASGGAATIVANEIGRPAGPSAIERAVRDARASVPGLPTGFSVP